MIAHAAITHVNRTAFFSPLFSTMASQAVPFTYAIATLSALFPCHRTSISCATQGISSISVPSLLTFRSPRCLDTALEVSCEVNES
jgi:hypothetical protein